MNWTTVWWNFSRRKPTIPCFIDACLDTLKLVSIEQHVIFRITVTLIELRQTYSFLQLWLAECAGIHCGTTYDGIERTPICGQRRFAASPCAQAQSGRISRGGG